ncbi:MAG: biotin transporter BioY [Caldilineaceae bacterium]|nr:biotin transporter BioY [Caldilineaceae bacterium]
MAAMPVIFFALLTAVTARITIPLPFTVVPITLQTLAVLLSGLVLGSRAGALSQTLYLAAIATGLPITASGIGGVAAFVTPTAGYLLSFVASAFVAGYLLEQLQGKNLQPLLIHMIAGLCGVLVIYMGGVAWLTILTGNFQISLQQGVIPFIGVDLGKAIAAALVASGGRLLFLPAAAP